MQELKISKLIAHRGASGEAPENTLIAIQKAIDIGVDCIEFDVRLTKDCIPVVIHDATMSRITGSNNVRYVHDLTLEQIKTLDIGSWFDPQFTGLTVPTLEEVLHLTSNQTGLMIEIKEGKQSPQIIVDRILKTVKSTHADPELLKFGSFSIPIIQEVLKSPSLNVIGIIEEVSRIQNFIDLKIEHLALWYKLIHPDLTQMLHDKNIDIWTFTVDDPEIARSLTSLSIAGIITNQPRYMRHLVSPFKNAQ